MEAQIFEEQVFENFRHLLDHQQSIIHAALIASGILLAAVAWCATHERPRWVPLVALAGIVANACAIVPAIRSYQLYQVTLDYGAEAGLTLLEQYGGGLGGFSPVLSVLILGGGWVALLAGLGVARLARALAQWLSLEYPRRT